MADTEEVQRLKTENEALVRVRDNAVLEVLLRRLEPKLGFDTGEVLDVFTQIGAQVQIEVSPTGRTLKAKVNGQPLQEALGQLQQEKPALFNVRRVDVTPAPKPDARTIEPLDNYQKIAAGLREQPKARPSVEEARLGESIAAQLKEERGY